MAGEMERSGRVWKREAGFGGRGEESQFEGRGIRDKLQDMERTKDEREREERNKVDYYKLKKKIQKRELYIKKTSKRIK